jgi:RNA polymerase sigma-70 factor (ECF subfamily)
MTPTPPADGPRSDATQRRALEAMLRQAAQGDQEAWREIVNTYSPRVFGLLRAQCNSADLAEEVAQSTFVTVASKINSYTELGKFEPWVFRIAMNRLRDEMRRRKRQARAMESEALAALPDRAQRPGQPEDRAEPVELAALRAALGQLSEADQMIIHLRHHGGLSFKQIAEILDQPLGTVLAKQHRALKKLAEILERTIGKPHPDD